MSKRNWRWWAALIPTFVVLVFLHGLAALGGVLSEVFEWFEIRFWRLRLLAMRACHAYTLNCRAWIFKARAAEGDGNG